MPYSDANRCLSNQKQFIHKYGLTGDHKECCELFEILIKTGA